MKKTLLVALMACATCSPAFAAGWGVQTTITGFFLDTAAGAAYLKTASNQNIDGCSSASYLAINMSSTGFKELYATLMAAQLAGSTVSLLYNGCYGSYPNITSIAVPNVW
jgi:hypothetical protein